MQTDQHLLAGRVLKLLYSEARAKHWLKAGPKALLTQSNADFLPLKIQA